MFQVNGLNIPKCRFMDSKKVPLWLGFVNADPDGDELKGEFDLAAKKQETILKKTHSDFQGRG